MKYALIKFLLLFLLASPCLAQKQFILLKHGKVVQRFLEGEYIKCVMKNGQHKEGIIVELADFSMITSADTIPFIKIEKIDIRSHHSFNLTQGFGGLFFVSGILYFSLDQLNGATGHGPKGIDKGVTVASASLVAAGLAIVFIKPRYQKVNHGVFMRTIDYTSPFYKAPEH